MSEELKPCPFCQDGGTISIDNVDLSESWVWCEKCGAETSTYPSVSEAIAAWNQRAKPCIDVDRLANIIRTVDGSNTMGAGDLAEAVVNHLEGYDHVED